MAYEHIKITRDEPVRERHPRSYFPPNLRPDDPRGFGQRLSISLAAAREQIQEADTGGFDSRLLLKVNLREGAPLPELEAIGGISIVSQEDKTVVLAFATVEGLAEFEARLATLSQSGNVTRKDILFSIERFERWTPDNRTGNALRAQGFPNRDAFVLDIELWPLESHQHRAQSLESFEQWARQQNLEVLDKLNQPSLVLLRVRSTQVQAGLILNHRDVRTVDLPPSVGISLQLLQTDVNQFPAVPQSPEDAPRLAVLDSGITQGHPLLSPAIGDAQGFVAPHRDASDNAIAGHGTFVAGLALYGDVAEQIRQGKFIPQLQLFSGRVFNDDGTDQTEFVEKCVDEAVRYFKDNYGCRVFNLSYGDFNKVYDGRHVRGLAYTLDRLTRELGVLFVVPTGNLTTDELPSDPHVQYPHYLLEPPARLLEPAPALNAITVGGLAVVDISAQAQRHKSTIEDVPIAAPLQPSPFTRSGFSVGDAIKPDFVEEAGNLAVTRSGGNTRHHGLGIVSMNSGFATGHPFREDHGTSFAAPKVAHTAAKLAGRFPENSVNLVRAILACHASWPEPAIQLLNLDADSAGKKSLLKLVGYGRIAEDALIESDEQVVTLYAEDRIGNNHNQFYELPLPDELWSSGKRQRQISIALAYSPEVRTTRLDYKQTKLSFSLVEADSLNQVADAFTRNREQGLPERSGGRSISGEMRKPSTLQASTWTFQVAPRSGSRKLFIVVTRQDTNWSTRQDSNEPYALSVVIRDRENATVNLHERISAIVQARAQERARARVRT